MKKVQLMGKALSKNDQKAIKGGDDVFDSNDEAGGYKCCWDNDPTNCSDCVPGGYPSCEKNASPEKC